MKLLQGDCFEVMQSLEDNSVDLVLTDPPYGLKFMGKKWDYDVPTTHVWYECLRVLKPGGHVIAFSGSRTYHRMACRIEDAGFEIRDMLAWLYGSGFPKSKTQLKPAIEPMVMARKPLDGTIKNNVEQYGVAQLNIDDCRVGLGSGVDRGEYTPNQKNNVYGSGMGGGKWDDSKGRWPANLIHDGSEEVFELFPHTKSGSAARFFYAPKASSKERWKYLTCDCETVKLDAWKKLDQNQKEKTDSTLRRQDTSEDASTESSCCSTSTTGPKQTDPFHTHTNFTTSTETSKTIDSKTCDLSRQQSTNEYTADANLGAEHGGSHAKFAPKCSQSTKSTSTSQKRDGRSMGVVVDATSQLWSKQNVCANCGKNLTEISHPTQKPIALMEYLVKLASSEGQTILDPFMGSGTTGIACQNLNRNFIGIEMNEEYFEIAKSRINNAVVETLF